jgi:hypothetical protein
MKKSKKIKSLAFEVNKIEKMTMTKVKGGLCPKLQASQPK